MKRLIITLMLASSLVASISAYTLELTPGALGGKLASLPAETTLTLTGSADARDIASLSDLPSSYRTLDLSGLSIQELKASAPVLDNRTYFPAGEIPPYAFFKSGLSQIILPSGLTKIGAGAFAHSSLTSVAIPEGVTSLGDYAFYGCESLKSVSLPKTLASVGTAVFASNPALTDIHPERTALSALPERTFAGCSSLADLLLGSIQVIGPEAFQGTAITTLDLSGVRSFGDYALAGMPKLTEVTLNDKASLGKGLLMDDSALKRVNTSLADVPGLFAANCRLLQVDNILEGTSKVGNYAFANAAADTIMLGPSVTSLGEHAFSGISNLSFIEAESLGANVPDVQDNTFSGVDPAAVTLHVADFTEDAWRSHPVWSQFDIKSNGSVGIDSATASTDAISVAIRARHIIIEAPAPLTDVAVYSADGTLVGRWAPDSEAARISLEDLPAGIVVVNARTADAERTVKLMAR